jgi:hypothetical protein
VFIHEVSYWLAAGIVNVHAKGSIQWPEAQEIAELDLSFVELEKNAHPFKLALITLAPIITGLVAVWFIANNILDFSAFFRLISSGELDDISTAVGNLTMATDFWLWIYLLFVIGNTMIPKLNNLKGFQGVLIAIAIAAGALILIGVGEPVVLSALTGPVADALNLLSGTFVIIILIDLLFVAALGTIEALIERATGHSAMFRRGKLVAMTRQEMLEARQRQARRDARALPKGTTQSQVKPSVYSQTFDVPGPPGEEPVTQSETLVIGSPSTSALPRRDDRRAPDIIMAGNRTSTAPALKEPVPEPKDSSENVDTKILTPTRPAPSPIRGLQSVDPDNTKSDDKDDEIDDEDASLDDDESSAKDKVVETASSESNANDDESDDD